MAVAQPPSPGDSPVAAPAVATSATPAVAAVASGDRIKVSPYAKKLASEKNVPLNELSGSGPGGRIRADDVNTYVPQTKPSSPVKASSPSAPSTASIPAGKIRTDLLFTNDDQILKGEQISNFYKDYQPTIIPT